MEGMILRGISGDEFKEKLEKIGLTSRQLATLSGIDHHCIESIMLGLEEASPVIHAILSLWSAAGAKARQKASVILASASPRGIAEEWRVISGASRYEVSDMGRVRRVSLGAGAMPGHILRPTEGVGGHLKVTVYCDDGNQWRTTVHHLVAITFIGLPPSPGLHVLHNDGKSWNCTATNLRWGTPLENARDRSWHFRYGRKPRDVRDACATYTLTEN